MLVINIKNIKERVYLDIYNDVCKNLNKIFK